MDLSEELNREIRTDAVDFSFGEILNLHREGEIIIRPEYQRLFRWSNEQRSRLIESIILQLPIPPIFLVENEDGVLELIDGLQRTSSVLQFLDNNAIGEPRLQLTGCDIIKSINDMYFENFPVAVRMRIKRTPIRAIVIKKSGDEFVKYEMFKRLNTGGSLLSPQEIRNCSSRMIDGGEEFYAFLQELAADERFKIAIDRLSDTDLEKKGDEELVIRFFAARHYRDGFKGSVQEWLDGYMEQVLFQNVPFPREERRVEFLEFFEVIADKLSGNAFCRYKNGEPQGRLAPAYFEAVTGGLARRLDFVRNLDSTAVREKLVAAFADEGFQNATGPGANSIEKFNQRVTVVSRHFD